MGLSSIFKVRIAVAVVSRNTSILSLAVWFILPEIEFKTEAWGIAKSNYNGAILTRYSIKFFTLTFPYKFPCKSSYIFHLSILFSFVLQPNSVRDHQTLYDELLLPIR